MSVYSDNHYLNVLGQLNIDEANIQQAFEYYRQRYQGSEFAKLFVSQNCSIDKELKASRGIGYCDRTMGKHIPKARTFEGASIRGSLQRSGLVRASGHELFRGCVVFPNYHENGNIISAVGYRIGRIRSGESAVVYWHRPDPKSFIDIGMSLAKELLHGPAQH
ncbi:MAG: hypothetical protein GY738_12160 [Pseudoalteromonas sp.]|nr:hypothetical protein [Pseudoalteromonas sp.]